MEKCSGMALPKELTLPMELESSGELELCGELELLYGEILPRELWVMIFRECLNKKKGGEEMFEFLDISLTCKLFSELAVLALKRIRFYRNRGIPGDKIMSMINLESVVIGYDSTDHGLILFLEGLSLRKLELVKKLSSSFRSEYLAVPDAVFRLTSLTTLNLSPGMYIKDYEQLTSLINLKKLTVEGNIVNRISDFMYLSRLEKVSVAGFFLPNLSQISKFTNLVELSMEEVSLTHLPLELFQLTKLKCLCLTCGSRLKVIPAEISQLTNLTHITFDCLQLNSLPEQFTLLTNLTTLHIYDSVILSPAEVHSINSLPLLKHFDYS